MDYIRKQPLSHPFYKKNELMRIEKLIEQDEIIKEYDNICDNKDEMWFDTIHKHIGLR